MSIGQFVQAVRTERRAPRAETVARAAARAATWAATWAAVRRLPADGPIVPGRRSSRSARRSLAARSCHALLLLAVLDLSPAGLALSRAAVAAGRVLEIEVPATALSGNLLGTPTRQSAAVYLPPSYEREPGRRYPIVYLLHGIFDTYDVWLEHVGVPAILDRLIDSGEIPELVMVMPNGGNRYGGGFYRDSSVGGRWGDYIVDDLVGFVDERFRTLAAEGGRALVGHSMGGYGALHLAMTRPGVFSVVWAMSPCCLAASDDFGFGNDAWKRAARIATATELQDLLAGDDFFAVAVLGVVTAFSPDPDDPPLYADFPFELVRGEVVLDELAYDRYLDALPTRQVHAAREALRGLRGLALGVGLGDQFLHIPPATLEFSRRLGTERIPHLLEVHAGDHRRRVGERLESVVLPWIGARLASDE